MSAIEGETPVPVKAGRDIMSGLIKAAAMGVGIVWCAATAVGAAEPTTELGKLAASLQPGEMKELQTKGYTHDLLKSWYAWDHDAKGTRIYGAQAMFSVVYSWSHDAKWDPKTRQVLFIGIGHYAAMKFVSYSADRNEWALMPVPTWADPRSIECRVAEVMADGKVKLSAGKDQAIMEGDLVTVRRDTQAVGRVVVRTVDEKASTAEADGKGEPMKVGDVVCNGNREKRSWPVGHMYDRLAISPEHRLFAVNWYGLHIYDIDRREWTRGPVAQSGGKGAYQVCEYFPELKSFVFTTDWGRTLKAWNADKKAELTLGSYPFGMDGVMEYNPVHKLMVFGRGDGDEGKVLYRMDAQGKVEKLKLTPIHFNCLPESKLLCDPVSGEYLVQEYALGGKGIGGGRVYAFHPVRDEWREIPGLKFPIGLGVAIDTYGVLMFCAGDKVFVYKHKPVWAEGAGVPAADDRPAGNTEPKR